MAVQNITEQDFQAEVLSSTQPVLVDFWAAWCGPCQMMGPVLEEVAAAQPALKVCKMNTDENINMVLSLGINEIPALVAYKGGQEVARSSGYRPRADLEAWLRQNALL